MADAAVSKTVEGNLMGVRVPPSALMMEMPRKSGAFLMLQPPVVTRWSHTARESVESVGGVALHVHRDVAVALARR